MKSLYFLATVVAVSVATPAVAADIEGYVHITGGNIVHLEDLSAQFPGADVFGGTRSYTFAGSYPDTSSPLDGRVGPDFSLSSLGSVDLNSYFSSFSESSVFFLFPLTDGDSVYVSVKNISYGEFSTPAAPVPELATWAMMLAGFGVVGTAMRRPKVSLTYA